MHYKAVSSVIRKNIKPNLLSMLIGYDTPSYRVRLILTPSGKNITVGTGAKWLNVSHLKQCVATYEATGQIDFGHTAILIIGQNHSLLRPMFSCCPVYYDNCAERTISTGIYSALEEEILI